MSDREAIHTSDSALHSLWATVNAKRRAGTTTLKVDADALANVLKDHHTLITALQSRKLLAITLNPDQESLKP